MTRFYLRLMDLVLALTGLIALSPIILTILLLGFLDTGSPVFFQTRVGKKQKPFTLLKFRTMAVNTQSVGTHLVNAAAVTKVGAILRRTKLDELPQLYNVLVGDMSLVGPRPCLPNQLELINERQKRNVFDIRPGITGLGQINEIDMSTPRKLARYDQTMGNPLSTKLYFTLIIATLLGQGRGDRVSKTSYSS